MAWASKRDTTREEDIVYSLFGMFEVHMPLIYGEGKEKALSGSRKRYGSCGEIQRPVFPRARRITIRLEPRPRPTASRF